MKNSPEQKPKKQTMRKASKSIQKKMFSYIAAGLGLVAGLAWNDAIKVLIENLIPDIGNTIIAKIVYAILLTVIVGVFLFYIERSIDKKED